MHSSHAEPVCWRALERKRHRAGLTCLARQPERSRGGGRGDLQGGASALGCFQAVRFSACFHRTLGSRTEHWEKVTVSSPQAQTPSSLHLDFSENTKAGRGDTARDLGAGSPGHGPRSPGRAGRRVRARRPHGQRAGRFLCAGHLEVPCTSPSAGRGSRACSMLFLKAVPSRREDDKDDF